MGDIQCYDRVDREHVERSKQNDIAAQQEETRHATALEQIRANCAAAVRRGSISRPVEDNNAGQTATGLPKRFPKTDNTPPQNSGFPKRFPREQPPATSAPRQDKGPFLPLYPEDLPAPRQNTPRQPTAPYDPRYPVPPPAPSSPATSPQPPAPRSGPLPARLCAAGDPSLEGWNRRFVAYVQQQWAEASRYISRKNFPNGFFCTAKYSVSSTSDGQHMEMAVADVRCYPPGFKNQLRSFLAGFPIENLPFPAGVMPSTQVDKEATFSWGYNTGYTRGPFQDKTVQVIWP